MDITSQIELENELRTMGIDQLRRERLCISRDLNKLQEQIGDLAFNNYRTYADAGRTTQHCTEIFTEMNTKLKEISNELPHLTKEIKKFFSKSRQLNEQYEVASFAADEGNPLWELIELPQRMDVCIRAGYYEAAYALTNYGMQLHQTNLVNNKLVKQIADKLVEARSFLLEELFNKFAGPLDLAQSIQVVNNVSKIPYLSNTQLRVSVLQYRDMYLDKQILDITTHPKFVLNAIEVFRDCMYDTMVLYLAVFPENEIQRRDPSIDPRWEKWPSGPPSAVLSEWATRNIQRLLDLVHRADMKEQVDMSTVWSKLMSFASSFGRMGLDFRSIIVQTLTKTVEAKFQTILRQVTHRMVNEVKRIDVMVGDVGSFPTHSDSNAPPHPPAELSMWDDLCVYGNGVLEALNTLRFSLTPVLLPTVLSSLRQSLQAVFSWLGSQSGHAHFARATRILAIHLVTFLKQCILFYFPYSTIGRLFGSSMTKGEYEKYCDLDVLSLISEADGAEKIEEVLLPLLNPSKMDEVSIDEMIRRVQENTRKSEDAAADSDAIEPSSIVLEDKPSIGQEKTPPPSSPRLESSHFSTEQDSSTIPIDESKDPSGIFANASSSHFVEYGVSSQMSHTGSNAMNLSQVQNSVAAVSELSPPPAYSCNVSASVQLNTSPQLDEDDQNRNSVPRDSCTLSSISSQSQMPISISESIARLPDQKAFLSKKRDIAVEDDEDGIVQSFKQVSEVDTFITGAFSVTEDVVTQSTDNSTIHRTPDPSETDVFIPNDTQSSSEFSSCNQLVLDENNSSFDYVYKKSSPNSINHDVVIKDDLIDESVTQHKENSEWDWKENENSNVELTSGIFEKNKDVTRKEMHASSTEYVSKDVQKWKEREDNDEREQNVTSSSNHHNEWRQEETRTEQEDSTSDSYWGWDSSTMISECDQFELPPIQTVQIIPSKKKDGKED